MPLSHPSRVRRRHGTMTMRSLASVLLMLMLASTPQASLLAARLDQAAAPLLAAAPFPQPIAPAPGSLPSALPGALPGPLPAALPGPDGLISPNPLAPPPGAATDDPLQQGILFNQQLANAAASAAAVFPDGTGPPKAKAEIVSKLDLQTFPGALGGIRASSIIKGDTPNRPFQVGNDNFDNFVDASLKSCEIQRGRCAIASAREQQGERRPGGGAGGEGDRDRDADMVRENAQRGGNGAPPQRFSVNDCEQQKNQCEAAQRTAPIKTFNLDNLGPDPAEPDFDLICMAP